MARAKRQTKILELIKKFSVETQEELVSRLKADGFDVTQATISRDIKELSLTKILIDGGKYKYVQIENEEKRVSQKVINLFKESVLTIDFAENLIVIKTISGTANTAALLVDKLSMPEILGSIAGDDTFITVARSKSDAELVVARIKEISGL